MTKTTTSFFPRLAARGIALLLIAAGFLSASTAYATLQIDFRVSGVSGAGVSLTNNKAVAVTSGSSGTINVDFWMVVTGTNAVDDELFQTVHFGAKAALASGAAPTAGGWGTFTNTAGTATGTFQAGTSSTKTSAQPTGNTDLYGGLTGVTELGDTVSTSSTGFAINRMSSLTTASALLTAVGPTNFNWINNPGGAAPVAGAGFEIKLGTLPFTLTNMPVGVLNINDLRRNNLSAQLFRVDGVTVSSAASVSSGANIVVTTTGGGGNVAADGTVSGKTALTGATSIPLTFVSGYTFANNTNGGNPVSTTTTSGMTVTGGGSGLLGTTASIVDASFTTGHAVTMKWRTRTSGEASYPAPVANMPQLATNLVGASGAKYGVFGDVVDIRFDGANTFANTPTEAYVLQMSVLDAAFSGNHAALVNAANLGFLYLGWLDTTASPNGTNENWRHATEGNTGGLAYDTSDKKGYMGSYAAYRAANGNQSASASLGAWGVEITAGGANVWAVVNHNSFFAPVPEPSAFVLAGIGFIGLAGVVRRRRKLKAA